MDSNLEVADSVGMLLIEGEREGELKAAECTVIEGGKLGREVEKVRAEEFE